MGEFGPSCQQCWERTRWLMYAEKEDRDREKYARRTSEAEGHGARFALGWLVYATGIAWLFGQVNNASEL